MRAQPPGPPQFKYAGILPPPPPTLRARASACAPKKRGFWQRLPLAPIARHKHTPFIFLSAVALVQCVPMLDRVFASQVSLKSVYEFTVEPTGVIKAKCAQGSSRIELVPNELLETSEGNFRKVEVRASLCTDFGYRTRTSILYMPNELLLADSDVIQGAWETKTYTGVPSLRHSDQTITLQIRRVATNQLDLVPLAEGFEQPEFSPVRVTLAQADEMTTVPNWTPGLLPLKAIRFEIVTPFLAQPVVLEGSLMRVRPASRI